MMMIAPNSLARQKEEAQGEEKEEAGGRRKAEPTRTLTPSKNAPIGLTWSGMSDERKRKEHGWQCGF